MASLSIAAGTVNATLEETNARANKMLTTYAEAIGATGTNNEKALQVLKSLVRHMIETNRRYRTNQAQAAASAALQAELDDLYWGDAPESPNQP